MKIIGVKFQETGKTYSFDADDQDIKRNDRIIVETEEGLAFGTVRVEPSEPSEKQRSMKLKKLVRKADEEDLMQLARNREKESSAFDYCRSKIAEAGLQMKLVNVEYLFDGSKATFFFTADERVDFRELVKDLAGRFHTRIELRQIGVRDEARTKGGIGPCGRVLCCSTWISEFEPVSVKMAKKQGLSLNPSNISGMCGRLMCCLAFEYQNYVKGFTPASYARTVAPAEEPVVEMPARERPVRERPARPARTADRPQRTQGKEETESSRDAKPKEAGKSRRRRRPRKKKKSASRED